MVSTGLWESDTFERILIFSIIDELKRLLRVSVNADYFLVIWRKHKNCVGSMSIRNIQRKKIQFKNVKKLSFKKHDRVSSFSDHCYARNVKASVENICNACLNENNLKRLPVQFPLDVKISTTKLFSLLSNGGNEGKIRWSMHDAFWTLKTKNCSLVL